MAAGRVGNCSGSEGDDRYTENLHQWNERGAGVATRWENERIRSSDTPSLFFSADVGTEQNLIVAEPEFDRLLFERVVFGA